MDSFVKLKLSSQSVSTNKQNREFLYPSNSNKRKNCAVISTLSFFLFSKALSIQIKLLHNIPLCLLDEISERSSD